MDKIGLNIMEKISFTKKVFDAKKLAEKTSKVVQSVFDSDLKLAPEPSEEWANIITYDGSFH